MSITKQLQFVKSQLPEHVSLVAVSKTKPNSDILEAYNAGQRIFGENKIQDMVDKHAHLPKDIQWHMIGNVQRNKVKYMASFVDLIHGIDSLKLLKEVDKQAKKHNRVIDCLIQIKIASEDSKHGISYSDSIALLESDDLATCKNIKVIGLMGMSTFTDDTNQIKSEFEALNNHFIKLKITHPNLTILSMGMSGDYPLAIACGSTMVRIGSSIFGNRIYN
jgi:pyridoxal phosphate enzyme (YggS family)